MKSEGQNMHSSTNSWLELLHKQHQSSTSQLFRINAAFTKTLSYYEKIL